MKKMHVVQYLHVQKHQHEEVHALRSAVYSHVAHFFHKLAPTSGNIRVCITVPGQFSISTELRKQTVSDIELMKVYCTDSYSVLFLKWRVACTKRGKYEVSYL